MKKPIIIEAPSNLGLKEPAPGKEPGTKLFSKALLRTDFTKKINVPLIVSVEPPPYDIRIDEKSGIRNADLISRYSLNLANTIIDSQTKGYFSIVLGGDCSILLGCTLGLKQIGDYGLFFLDGHTDYMLPKQSATAGAAGMDLALVTGNGPDILSNMQTLGPYIKEENVFCAGNREYIDWYVETIKKSKIQYYDLRKLQEVGQPGIISTNFLNMVSDKGLKGFWIHLDVDVLDDQIMPCVDSRTEGGLSYEELHTLLKPLLVSQNCCGINITIFDPTLDETGKYISELSEQLIMLFDFFVTAENRRTGSYAEKTN